MKTSLSNIDGSEYRQISIKNGKVFVMTCKKGRVKGKASSYTPKDPALIEDLFNKQVKRAHDEGYTLSVSSEQLTESISTVYYAEIDESVWDQSALETFLAVDMVIPSNIRETPVNISGSHLVVRRTVSKYIVNGQVESKTDSNFSLLDNQKDHVGQITTHLAPLLVLSSKVIFSTDGDNDGSIEHTSIDPLQYVQDSIAAIPDNAKALLAKAGFIRIPVSMDLLPDNQQDCSFCI